jgi:hypothetical protein
MCPFAHDHNLVGIFARKFHHGGSNDPDLIAPVMEVDGVRTRQARANGKSNSWDLTWQLRTRLRWGAGVCRPKSQTLRCFSLR